MPAEVLQVPTPQIQRGERSWALLRREWGDAVADALWQEKPVKIASGPYIYEMQYRHPWAVKVRNLSTNMQLCVSIEDSYQYPMGDCLLGLLDHIRLDPLEVERIAGHTPIITYETMRTYFRTGVHMGWSLGTAIRHLAYNIVAGSNWFVEHVAPRLA